MTNLTPANLDARRQSVLVGIMGLPGTGKTHVAQYLARRYSLVLLSTDSIR